MHEGSIQEIMEGLYLACILLSAAAVVVMTAIIPYGVVMRYLVHSPQSWPEPLAVLLMIVFTFIGGAGVYRAQVHIRINALLDIVKPEVRRKMLLVADALMVLACLFMVGYGAILVQTTWFQSIAEFPGLSVGFTYLPIPVSGFVTLLFVIEVPLDRAPARDFDHPSGPAAIGVTRHDRRDRLARRLHRALPGRRAYRVRAGTGRHGGGILDRHPA
jgi:TRAP-type C4-dicarboxylate transport system permease small subunit